MSATDEWVKKGNQRTYTRDREADSRPPARPAARPPRRARRAGRCAPGDAARPGPRARTQGQPLRRAGRRRRSPRPGGRRVARPAAAAWSSSRWRARCRSPVPAVAAGQAAAGSSRGLGAGGGRLPRIDVHTHIGPDGIDRALALMDRWGIDGVVNLSGMYPGPAPPHAGDPAGGGRARGRADRRVRQRRLRAGGAAAQGLRPVPRRPARGGQEEGGRRAEDLQGAGPGLSRARLASARCRSTIPAWIRCSRRRARWACRSPSTPAIPRRSGSRPGPKNERYDELKAHPEWSFYGQQARCCRRGSSSTSAFERRVARHPKTTFIGVHFGNAPEDPDQVARMLDKYPNLYIDTAARVPEIGRHDADEDAPLLREVPGSRPVRDRHRHRRQPGRDDVRLQRRRSPHRGGRGAVLHAPPGATSRPRDQQFEHPTPIQGRWKIDGVGLPEAILRKIYFENAARVLGWKPPPPTAARAAAHRGQHLSAPP